MDGAMNVNNVKELLANFPSIHLSNKCHKCHETLQSISCQFSFVTNSLNNFMELLLFFPSILLIGFNGNEPARKVGK